ncbi:hypothetical protein ACFQ4C_02060 [Larkinella insperata]|uniref:Uncharacterized protein n=1 Tax=Larkinella insperata TaxID=332158 RepID=A0ABW3PXK3_9BACT|nr:hypothetical protein [Larkinella insperata]
MLLSVCVFWAGNLVANTKRQQANSAVRTKVYNRVSGGALCFKIMK